MPTPPPRATATSRRRHLTAIGDVDRPTSPGFPLCLILYMCLCQAGVRFSDQICRLDKSVAKLLRWRIAAKG